MSSDEFDQFDLRRDDSFECVYIENRVREIERVVCVISRLY